MASVVLQSGALRLVLNANRCKQMSKQQGLFLIYKHHGYYTTTNHQICRQVFSFSRMLVRFA